MAQEIRAFIGIKIPASHPLKKVLASFADLGSAVKAVGPHNLHLTLKFLGDIDEGQLPAIQSVLQQAVDGQSVATARLLGLGAFPHLGRPSVVWVGLQGAESLSTIARTLDVELEQLGIPPESREFVPHVTLARIKRKPPPALAEIVKSHASTDFGEVTLREANLFRSDLLPEGPRYTVLATAEFRAS